MYMLQCEMLRLRFEEMEREKATDEHTLHEKHNTISRLVSHTTCVDFDIHHNLFVAMLY